MGIMQLTYTITELSKEFEVTTRTIRFYEEKGLLAPQRNGQSRIYSSKDRTVLKLVIRGKRLGFSLQETVELLELYDPEQGNLSQLESMLQKISLQKEKLRQQRQDIDVMMEELNLAQHRCESALQETPK